MTRETVRGACLQLVQSKLASLQEQLDELRAGAENDSKSSSGDKHETSRAMMHLEQEQLVSQQTELHGHLQQLHALKHSEPGSDIRPGNLIQTNSAAFYLSTGLGKIEVSGQFVFALSPRSPLGQLLVGKKTGDKVQLHSQHYEILGID